MKDTEPDPPVELVLVAVTVAGPAITTLRATPARNSNVGRNEISGENLDKGNRVEFLNEVLPALLAKSV